MIGRVQPFLFEKEYEKNPDIEREDIQKLKEWLRTQPHLPGEFLTDYNLLMPATSSAWIEVLWFPRELFNLPRYKLAYLDLIITFHSCDNSAQVTKQVLDLHYTLRTLFTTLFKDRVIDQRIISAMNTVLLAPLPTPTVKGYRAVYCSLLESDARLFNFSHVIRTIMMVIDLWQYAEGTWPGFVIIIDMNQATLAHIAKLELMTLRQTLYFLQECMLVRLKEVHFINAPSFMDKLMMLLKPFLKKALLDMIHIHETGSEELHKYVPKEAFPKDSGGDYKNKTAIRDELISWVQDNKQFYIEENKRRVNESLRPGGKETTVEDIFSIQGSFKKLDID